MLSRLAVLLAGVALALTGVLACGDGDKPSGFSMPSACRVASGPEKGPEGLRSWVLRCEDSEHIFTPDEARPLLEDALFDAGWRLCGAAAGTAYFAKDGRVTTLAFATNDRRDPSFGEVYLGQQQRTVECP